jgi:hypothetical protein
MVSDFLAKSYGGLSYEGIYLYVNSRVEKRNLLNQAELHYKLGLWEGKGGLGEL